jgi:hypothetical protein
VAAKKTGRLSREDVQKIVDAMSARDMFQSTLGTESLSETERGLSMSERIFDKAAARLGYGEKALDRVGLSDGAWLMEQLAESLNMGGKEAGGTEGSPDSSDTGESPQS